MVIRTATPADAAGCAAIYAPYVRDTAITFETEPPSADRMAERIAAALENHTWLVADEDGTICGYAYGGPFAARPAYRWSAETSVYLDTAQRGRGLGGRLYSVLLDRLRERGFSNAVAGITLPNPASLALHDRLGFAPVGVHRAIGFKNGAWHDVWRGQLALRPTDGPPAPLR